MIPTMIPTVQILVLLSVVVAAVTVMATRLQVPAAILLVLTGVALALCPDCRRSSSPRSQCCC